jgi:hypothetical protein
MKILIINHSVENCGVYQYGKRFGNILLKSKKHNFYYLEINSQDKLEENIIKYNPSVIIYNYLGGTMPWVNELTVQSIRERGIKQLLLVHNVEYATFFDYYLHQNPDYPSDNKNFSILRPLFDYNGIESKDDDIINIGSFGFGFRVKHFDQICSLINSQFNSERVNINLHLTISYFCPNANDILNIKNNCLRHITKPNISLNMTHDFLSDQEMLNFLYKNDLNIFLYEKYNTYNGISSTIDYALSVKKPIAICRSNMFSHIYDVKPSICIEENSLKNIINNGFDPLFDKYNSWTNEKFIQRIESIIEEKINL